MGESWTLFLSAFFPSPKDEEKDDIKVSANGRNLSGVPRRYEKDLTGGHEDGDGDKNRFNWCDCRGYLIIGRGK